MRYVEKINLSTDYTDFCINIHLNTDEKQLFFAFIQKRQ